MRWLLCLCALVAASVIVLLASPAVAKCKFGTCPGSDVLDYLRGPHFLVSYCKSLRCGSNLRVTEAYAQDVLDVAERAYAYASAPAGLGFRRPPKDDLFAGGERNPDQPARAGPLDKPLIDIVIVGAGDLPAGYASEAAALGSAPDGKLIGRLFIGHDLSAGERRYAVTHEVFHLFQMGYEREDHHSEWLAEASAAWFEWNFLGVGPEFSGLDRHKMDTLYSSPETSLLAEPNRYASWTWIEFLTRTYGDRIVREIWESFESPNGDTRRDEVGAVRAAITARGGDPDRLFANYAVALSSPDPWVPGLPSRQVARRSYSSAIKGSDELALPPLSRSYISLVSPPTLESTHFLRFAVASTAPFGAVSCAWTTANKTETLLHLGNSGIGWGEAARFGWIGNQKALGTWDVDLVLATSFASQSAARVTCCWNRDSHESCLPTNLPISGRMIK